jgi:hypothetical protein
MKLPGADNAIVDIVTHYCLDPLHPRGRHKARVFAATLGLTPANTEILRDELLAAAREADAVPGNYDDYRDRYTVDFQLEHGGRIASIWSAWIVLHRESSPRLTSCFVLLD